MVKILERFRRARSDEPRTSTRTEPSESTRWAFVERDDGTYEFDPMPMTPERTEIVDRLVKERDANL